MFPRCDEGGADGQMASHLPPKTPTVELEVTQQQKMPQILSNPHLCISALNDAHSASLSSKKLTWP